MIDQETKRLASILDAMGCGVYIIGDDYTIKLMNKASIKVFGEGIGESRQHLFLVQGKRSL
jgi:PAS domain-containing protein